MPDVLIKLFQLIEQMRKYFDPTKGKHNTGYVCIISTSEEFN